MSEQAFLRRFYSDRSELEAMGFSLTVERPGDDPFQGDLYALPPESYYLPAIDFDEAELSALQTCLYLLEGQFAYAEPLRLALQHLTLGRPSPLDDHAARTVAVNLLGPGLLRGGRGAPHEDRVGHRPAQDDPVLLLLHRARRARAARGRPVQPAVRRRVTGTSSGSPTSVRRRGSSGSPGSKGASPSSPVPSMTFPLLGTSTSRPTGTGRPGSSPTPPRPPPSPLPDDRAGGWSRCSDSSGTSSRTPTAAARSPPGSARSGSCSPGSSAWAPRPRSSRRRSCAPPPSMRSRSFATGTPPTAATETIDAISVSVTEQPPAAPSGPVHGPDRVVAAERFTRLLALMTRLLAACGVRGRPGAHRRAAHRPQPLAAGARGRHQPPEPHQLRRWLLRAVRPGRRRRRRRPEGDLRRAVRATRPPVAARGQGAAVGARVHRRPAARSATTTRWPRPGPRSSWRSARERLPPIELGRVQTANSAVAAAVNRRDPRGARRRHRVLDGVARGTITSRSIEPHLLVNARDAWYVVGWCRRAEEQRTFRLDRIRSARVTKRALLPPERDRLPVLICRGGIGPTPGGTLAQSASVWCSPQIARWLVEEHPSSERYSRRLRADRDPVRQRGVAGEGDPEASGRGRAVRAGRAAPDGGGAGGAVLKRYGCGRPAVAPHAGASSRRSSSAETPRTAGPGREGRGRGSRGGPGRRRPSAGSVATRAAELVRPQRLAAERPRRCAPSRPSGMLGAGAGAGVHGAAGSSATTSSALSHMAAPARRSALQPTEAAAPRRPRHGEDRAALLEREVGGDERAGSRARLDDDDGVGHPGDDAGCAPGTATAREAVPGQYSETSSPRSAMRPGQVAVAARVDHVDAAPEHGEGGAAGGQRALVGRAVDPERQPADHRGAPLGELARQVARERRGPRPSGGGCRRPRRTGPSAALASAPSTSPRRNSPNGGS